MNEYEKIETLYDRDPATFKFQEPLVLRSKVFGLVNPWIWTEKIDGTNIRIIWKDSKVSFAGRTDAAQIHPDLLKWMTANFTEEKLGAVFPSDATEVALYGEGCGAGIQKGGADYSSTKKVILFDVKVGQFWLSDANMRDVAAKLGVEAVPFVAETTLQAATEMVRSGIMSLCAEKPRQAEGLVGRPPEDLFDRHGRRLIVKLKTKDFGGSK